MFSYSDANISPSEADEIDAEKNQDVRFDCIRYLDGRSNNMKPCLKFKVCENLSTSFTKEDIKKCMYISYNPAFSTRFDDHTNDFNFQGKLKDGQLYNIDKNSQISRFNEKPAIEACKNFVVNPKLSKDKQACKMIKECKILQTNTFTKDDLDQCKVKLFGNVAEKTRFDGLAKKQKK